MKFRKIDPSWNGVVASPTNVLRKANLPATSRSSDATHSQ
jgi:hypothetical protein